MTRECHIYFIEAGKGGPVKIGRANYVATRLRDMQVGNHEQLTVLATFEGVPCNEKGLHELFRDNNIRGEWFERTEALEDAIIYLDRCSPNKAFRYIAKHLIAQEKSFQTTQQKPKKQKPERRKVGILGRGWTASA